MNGKISIVMMTTFSGNSFKGPQMPEIVNTLVQRNALGKSFGIWSPTDGEYYDKATLKKLSRTRLIKQFFRINKLLCKVFRSEKRYYLNEIVFGIFALFHRVDGDTVLLKPKPTFLVNFYKSRGKKIILEASENHSEYTLCQIENECQRLDIPLVKSIFTDPASVNDYAKSIKMADRLICLSQFSAQTYVDHGVSKEQLRIVPLYAKCDRSRPNIDLSAEVCFVCVANHSLLKGTHKLIRLWDSHHIQNELMIIGRIHSDLERLLQSSDHNENIRFMGTMTRQEINQIYTSKKCVNVLVSLSESYGRTVYEALCASVPVIVTETCTCDLVANGYNGLIISDKEQELLQAVERFINMDNETFNAYRGAAFDSTEFHGKSFGERYADALLQ